MSKSLTEIQTGVRYKARDDVIDMTDTGVLAITNNLYRRIATYFDWPEMRKTKELAATTVADQNSYAWDAAMPDFIDIKTVEIENEGWGDAVFGSMVFGIDSFSDSTVSDTWKIINPPPNELEWNLAGALSSVRKPYYYVRNYSIDNSRDEIEFRPAPSNTGDSIRVTGKVTPSPLTGLSSVTVFLSTEVDDALEYLIAYEILSHDGITDAYVAELRQKGYEALSLITGKDFKPKEIVEPVDA